MAKPCVSLLFVCVALIMPLAAAQQSSTPTDPKYVQSPSNPYYVDCGRDPNHKSQSAQSPVLTSPDGGRAAYASAKALWVTGWCVSTSRLFVRKDNGLFDVAFLQEPTEQESGNGIRVIDWSKDGKQLLFEVLQWQWASDAETSNQIWIYYAETGMFKTAPVQAFIRNTGKGCYTTVEPLGFSTNGMVAIKVTAKQGYDIEGDMRKPACKEKQSTWLFDPATNALTQTSTNYSAPTWGTMESSR